ncbi:MAG: methylcrotonoyl-CoA carboxylase [Bacteroidales bacterium]|nr:methylcrotonoyl-CoA carboxylase [Bacteroidales bacterium]
MEKIQSKLDTGSEDFLKNKQAFLQHLNLFKQRLMKVTDRTGEEAVQRHIRRGKLLARERIQLLTDRGSFFMELSPFASWDQYNNDFPSAGIITGIGIVHGRETVIVANDATVKGGTYIPETIRKHLRAQEIAMKNHLPCVYLVDSGGVFLPEQARVFPDRDHFGRIFYNQARMSAMGIPQIAVVMGSSTAGGAYVPAMCDETIMVRHQATVFLGGPPLVKAATGEVVTAEELGGADVHTSLSGVADYLAENDRQALELCRDILARRNKTLHRFADRQTPEDPAYDPAELYGVIPSDLRKGLDPYEVIARITDGSRFHEFKARYGTSLVTGFAHIMGYPVGIIANNGILFSDSALKATHFIELCKKRFIPLVFLQNIAGFIVGKEYEQAGIAKDGAKMVHAVATANVPKFTVITGRSYGAGNYAMAGRAYDPELLFMWPNAEIGVMGGEQAAMVLTMVKEDQMRSKGLTFSNEEKEKMEQEILLRYKMENSAWFSTSRVWDDGIIDPAMTRQYIASGISMTLYHEWDQPSQGIYRM